MSVYFVDGDDRDVWNPSSQTAQVFLDEVASMARILKMESGLGPIVSDEVKIDIVRFSDFANAFVRQMIATDHGPCFQALTGGCFSVVLGLHRELGMPPLTDDPRIDRYTEDSRRFVRRPR